MQLVRLRVAGFRGFNDEQPVELYGRVVIYFGANGAGKTSIGEAIEWLLYGRTVKRHKGDEISKREYAESYRNTHYTGGHRPYVEAEVLDQNDQARTIRRELNDDESSVLTVDGQAEEDLQIFGISTLYDRPLILQHPLQDFIFMKPKTRYEVLSSMLGLEGLIAFRNAVEDAKTELPKRLPDTIKQAQTQSDQVRRSFTGEPLLKPVETAIAGGNLRAAREQLLEVALGRVPAGTLEADLTPTLKATRAAKERGQLDWGRFSLAPVARPDEHEALTHLAVIREKFSEFHEKLTEALGKAAPPKTERSDSRLRPFVELGLELIDPKDRQRCPFCGESTLTPEKLVELRGLVEVAPEGKSVLAEAQGILNSCQQVLRTQREALQRLIPITPTVEERKTVEDLSTEHKDVARAYLDAAQTISEKVDSTSSAADQLGNGLSAASTALAGGKVTLDVDLNMALEGYEILVQALPAYSNAYSAAYAALDPHIKGKLASAEDARFLQFLIDGLETWKDIETASHVEASSDLLQDLIRQTRAFIEKKQTEILGVRDKEIKSWYDLLNPGAEVGYEKIVPGTDSLELRARSFSKTMMAAPNLGTSQLNCLGLAIYLACATRTGSPHRFLLFDDPIQSLDDEHTQSFKKDVIGKLRRNGYQVFVLTHMDPFANDLERLYRSDGAILYKMLSYGVSGPSIELGGPEIVGFLNAIRRNKDSVNEGYRKQATQDCQGRSKFGPLRRSKSRPVGEGVAVFVGRLERSLRSPFRAAQA